MIELTPLIASKMEEDRIRNIERKLDMILNYLNNDPYTGQNGLVAEQNEQRQRLIDLEVQARISKERSAALGGVTGGLIGGVIVAVQWVAKTFF